MYILYTKASVIKRNSLIFNIFVIKIVKKALTEVKAFNNIYSINTKNIFILQYRDFVDKRRTPPFHDASHLSGTREPLRYDGFAFPIKKALAEVKAFNNILSNKYQKFISLYRNFAEKRRTPPIVKAKLWMGPGNLGASHYAGFAFSIKKALT